MPMFASPSGLPCVHCGRAESPAWYKQGQFCSKYKCKKVAGIKVAKKSAKKKKRERDSGSDSTDSDMEIAVPQPLVSAKPKLLVAVKQVIGYRFKDEGTMSPVERRSYLTEDMLEPEYLVRGIFAEVNGDDGFTDTHWVSERVLAAEPRFQLRQMAESFARNMDADMNSVLKYFNTSEESVEEQHEDDLDN